MAAEVRAAHYRTTRDGKPVTAYALVNGSGASATILDFSGTTIDLRATTDQATVINLTNHIYFNLNGNSTTSVEGYRLQLLSDPVAFRDPLNAPTGALVAVEASPLDLRNPQSLGDLIAAASDPRFTGPAVTGTGSGRSFLVDNRRGVQDALNPTVQNKD